MSETPSVVIDPKALIALHGIPGDDTTVLVFDSETDINLLENDPAAHVKGTKVVLEGWRVACPPPVLSKVTVGPVGGSNMTHYLRGKDSPTILVGHNLTFDMLHLLHGAPKDDATTILKQLALGQCVLHDTQDMEYILTGHSTKWASLDSLAETYGVPGKKDTLKEHLAKGLNVSDMGYAYLVEYLKQDIITTEAVAAKQLPRWGTHPETRAQVQLAAMRRAVTTIMSFNGMPFDYYKAGDELTGLSKQSVEAMVTYDQALFKIADYMGASYVTPREAVLQLLNGVSSNKSLTTLLNGGTVHVEETVSLGLYKNGKPKTKKTKVPYAVPSLLKEAGLANVESVDEHALTGVLKAVATLPTSLPGRLLSDVLKSVLEYRAASKILGTYIEPLLYMYTLSKTGNIHPSLNTCATATGRLSSSKPNAQNMPSSSPVKTFFKREGWACVEGDYKQLEMIALAVKSCDEQLLKDLADGVDIHYEVGKAVMGWTSPSDMTKETRRLVKSVDFGLVYGGGAKTLAAQSGASVTVVQSVIDSFFKRYPGVLAYHKRMEEIGKDVTTSVPTGNVLENGALERKKNLVCGITGRMYSFTSYANKYGRDKTGTSFSPTELKNYLVQGLATADFVPFACAVLAKAMAAGGWMDIEADGEPKAKLCNTVHDSIVVWVKDKYAVEFAQFMKAAMEVAWPMMFDFFGAPQAKRKGTEVVAEISIGPSWGETKEVE